ncbi:MAG: cytochrome P450 [Chloroflexi bacterium]|nr:cytochrome P450 [Chloroflexota bacterium]
MPDQPTDVQLEPIPQPPSKPIVGNLFDVDAGTAMEDMNRLARSYGPIFKLALVNRETVFVSGFQLTDEVCDEERFEKRVGAGLQQARSFAGDGLFTADTQDPNWRRAHNILMPALSQQAMRDYLPLMVDLATQLVKKWQRLNPAETIDVSADTARLSFDTVGLCGFGYRFNSFYRETPHPFVEAMTRCLSEAMRRTSRLPVQEKLSFHGSVQYDRDIASMNQLVDHVIEERRAHPERESGRVDLLARMLIGVDPESGESLDDRNIRYQIITFLIAADEPSSALLSFSLYLLLHHPSVLARAYAEVDNVLGSDLSIPPTYDQVHQLPYVRQILKEALRLYPPTPVFSRQPLHDDAVIGGKYRVTRHQGARVLSPSLHRDPAVWGEDADAFNPDRFSPDAEQARPANAYKPFGTGQRACIGQHFALQEATLALAMILQRFELIDHASYVLRIRETLTQTPEGFTMQVRARRRAGAATQDPSTGEKA